MFHGKRVTTKSNILRSPFYSRVADADAALSSEESKVAKYLFLINHKSNTDILFKSKSGQQSNRIQMERLGQDYVETNILDTWAVIHFGRYLYGLDHMKSRNMITAELEIGEYDWQTATVCPYASVFLMSIMETYMGKGMRNWDLRLNSNRTSEGTHGGCFRKYVIRFGNGKRTGQDKINGTLM
nr:hypothetical protein [Tanacetum cinerariifolium]